MTQTDGLELFLLRSRSLPSVHGTSVYDALMSNHVHQHGSSFSPSIQCSTHHVYFRGRQANKTLTLLKRLV